MLKKKPVFNLDSFLGGSHFPATKILILSENADFTLNLLRCLSDCGTENHVFGCGSLPAIARSRHCKKYIACEPEDFKEPETMLSRIRDYYEKEKPAVILAANMASSFLLSAVKHRLPEELRVFPIAEPAQLQQLFHKWHLACLLRENHLPMPETRLIERREEIPGLKMAFPLVIKPPDRGNKVGVKIVNSTEEIFDYLAAGNPDHRLPLLAQEFIPGIDVDLNALAEKGKLLAWSIQKWVSDDTLQFIEHEPLLDIGRRIMEVTDYTGVAHFDMRIDSRDNSVKVIECNPRFWGSIRASLWNGVNFVKLGIDRCFDRPLPEEIRNRKITYLLPSKIFKEIFHGNLFILSKIPEASLADFKQLVADPVSLACQLMAKVMRPPRGKQLAFHHG
jgi:predicted ATP-grasp superfamily ATP-dependent carboligase